MSRRYQNMTREAITMFCYANSGPQQKVNTMEKFALPNKSFRLFIITLVLPIRGTFETNAFCEKLCKMSCIENMSCEPWLRVTKF